MERYVWFRHVVRSILIPPTSRRPFSKAMNSRCNQKHIHLNQWFFLARFITRLKVGNGLKIMIPDTSTIQMKRFGCYWSDFDGRPGYSVAPVSIRSNNMGCIHSTQGLEGNTWTSSMNERIINNIRDIVEVDPWFEVVSFGVQDLSNHKLKENSTCRTTNISLGDEIQSVKSVTRVVCWGAYDASDTGGLFC